MIVDLRASDTKIIEQLALLVHVAFQIHAPNWLPTLCDARQEIFQSLELGKVSRVLVDTQKQPIGWIGVTPHNRGRVWEIHPLVVAAAEQNKGYGRMLIQDIETLARDRGALTLLVGTSDETNATTLGGADLYANPAQAIAKIRNLKRHPYEFYTKIGFKVVGILPDAEGLGKPSITLAKRIVDACK